MIPGCLESSFCQKDTLAQQAKHFFDSFPKISMKYIFIVKLLLLYKYFFSLINMKNRELVVFCIKYNFASEKFCYCMIHYFDHEYLFSIAN